MGFKEKRLQRATLQSETHSDAHKGIIYFIFPALRAVAVASSRFMRGLAAHCLLWRWPRRLHVLRKSRCRWDQIRAGGRAT
jgi:hypothetical protein